jgi:glycosyltransferase involved in cell wall biosynthesis
LEALAQIRRSGRTGNGVCYIACDGGLGIIYAIAVAVAARMSALTLYVHHHSYGYIDNYNILMRTLLAVGSGKTIHIVLAPEMAQALANRYARTISAIVLSNLVLAPLGESVPGEPVDRLLTIGLLSNLTAEKGLHTFLDVMREARRQSIALHGILAGPIASPADKDLVECALQDLAGLLEYRGSIYGVDKQRFYRDINVFVFPTTYAYEAQPLVIFEALANGCPVISTDKGCIRNQIGDCGHVVENCTNFVDETLAMLRLYQGQPDLFTALRKSATRKIQSDRSVGNELIGHLFDAASIQFSPN